MTGSLFHTSHSFSNFIFPFSLSFSFLSLSFSSLSFSYTCFSQFELFQDFRFQHIHLYTHHRHLAGRWITKRRREERVGREEEKKKVISSSSPNRHLCTFWCSFHSRNTWLHKHTNYARNFCIKYWERKRMKKESKWKPSVSKTSHN